MICTKKKSIKSHERDRQIDGKGILANVCTLNQPLPVEMKKFWALSDNKVSFQQAFIKWMEESQIDNTYVFLGGSHSKDETICIGIINGSCCVERLLQCSHEEADYRIMLNLAVKISKFCSVVTASPERDMFVCASHHFSQLVYFGLNKFWFVSSRSNSLTIEPIHDLVEKMSADIIEILPAAHAYTTSKIGMKAAALKPANAFGYKHLCFFGKQELTKGMIYNADRFLLRCISNEKLDSFDNLRYDVYHKKLQEFDFEKFPVTSSAIKQHILRAYLQCHLWLHLPFIEDILTDPLQYGYSLNEEDDLVQQSSMAH